MNATYSNSKNCTNASCTEGKECNKCNQRRKGKGKMGTCGNCNDPATHAVLHAHEWRQGTGINKIASTIKRHWHDVLHVQRDGANAATLFCIFQSRNNDEMLTITQVTRATSPSRRRNVRMPLPWIPDLSESQNPHLDLD